MRAFIISVLLFCATFTVSAPAQNTNDQMYLNLNQKHAIENQKSIFFMGQPYYFGYGDELKNEYFPNGEGLSGWRSMIGIYVFKNQTDPLYAAQQMYDNLEADGQVAALAIHRFTKEPILTFFLQNGSGLELNLWRFYPNAAETEVIGMQYARSFKAPQNEAEQMRLKSLVQSVYEQFLMVPSQPFIW